MMVQDIHNANWDLFLHHISQQSSNYTIEIDYKLDSIKARDLISSDSNKLLL